MISDISYMYIKHVHNDEKYLVILVSKIIIHYSTVESD